MGMLTIMEKDAPCDADIDWPLFYMNDFSVLGVRVEGLDRAMELLESVGYRLIRSRCSAKVEFEGRDRLLNIFSTLQGSGIAFVTGDLASCAYQG